MNRKGLTNPGDSILSDLFEKQLKLYGVAAAAAAVGVLAVAEPADAKVIITNKTIPIVGGTTLDLNGDGVPDVKFSFFKTYAHYLGVAGLAIAPDEAGGGIMGKGGYASALMRSAKIGPSAHFSGGVNASSTRYVEIENNSCQYAVCDPDGKWGGNHPNRFLGVKFSINGETHYGWIRVTVNTITSGVNNILSGTITEYGYETIPNKRLLAGVPSNNSAVSDMSVRGSAPDVPSLGMLASGAEGLALWRMATHA